MPAESRRQFRWAQSCRHNPKHKGKCPSDKVLREFTAGVEFKKLPNTKKRKP